MTENNVKNANIPDFHLMIVAAGTGERMGLDTPKQYYKINSTPILRHSLNKFININSLKNILNVINPEHEALYHDAVQGVKNIDYLPGSNTRKNSVYNGLKYFSKVNQDDILLIHDAARPLVHEDDIIALLQAMENNVAATLASPIKDTLYHKDQTIDREGLWSIQTPQAFKIGALIEAHEKFKDDDSFTDDAGLMRAMGHQVEIVPSQHPNIKITTQDDLKIVEALMADNTLIRTALGFDVHAFETEPSDRKLIMGGIEIDHPLALTGHSDADVVLHAITDAILGAINAGDIGTHFPPSDTQWKDAASDQFLVHAHDLLKAKGGALTFIDVTILAEAPKIGPHRDAMQNRIAGILNISPDLISIKATTTEKLGFTGREEGIACQALATIELPK